MFYAYTKQDSADEQGRQSGIVTESSPEAYLFLICPLKTRAFLTVRQQHSTEVSIAGFLQAGALMSGACPGRTLKLGPSCGLSLQLLLTVQ